MTLGAKASDDDDAAGAAGADDEDAKTINEMMKDDLGVDVEAIKSLIDSDPAVREQERLMASEARNAASLQVDAQMAEEESKIAREYGSKGSEAGQTLKAWLTSASFPKHLTSPPNPFFFSKTTILCASRNDDDDDATCMYT